MKLFRGFFQEKSNRSFKGPVRDNAAQKTWKKGNYSLDPKVTVDVRLGKMREKTMATRSHDQILDLKQTRSPKVGIQRRGFRLSVGMIPAETQNDVHVLELKKKRNVGEILKKSNTTLDKTA